MPDRDLPISLRGIETVLRYLDQNDMELSSIRNVSRSTDLSMRVTKNILLHLENLNQVERIVEENKVIPKWKITKFGRKVVKKAQPREDEGKFMILDKKAELLKDIQIPDTIEEIKEKVSLLQEEIDVKLKILQADLSKTLGRVLNLNDPPFEDLMGFIVKRIKTIKIIIQNLTIDPTRKYQLRKIGEKPKKLKDKEKEMVLAEILFIIFIISNDIKFIYTLGERLSNLIEQEAYTAAYSIAEDLRSELRLISNLVNQVKKIKTNNHILTVDELDKVFDNEFEITLLDKIIEVPLENSTKQKAIEEAILNLLNLLNSGQKTLNNRLFEVKENIPLYALYQIILDDKPALRFTIDDMEEAINSLADKGHIPGIEVIEQDEDHYFKVVQLKAHDISEEENKLISVALRLEKFSLAEINEEMGWKKEKTLKILQDLSDIGILRHTRSFLHGDQWYIISEKK